MICLGTATDSITLWRAGSSQVADFHRVQLNITLLPKPQIKSIPFNVISARSEELTAKELHIDYATSILMKTTLKQHPESNVFLNSIKFHYQRPSIYFFIKYPTHRCSSRFQVNPDIYWPVQQIHTDKNIPMHTLILPHMLPFQYL